LSIFRQLSGYIATPVKQFAIELTIEFAFLNWSNKRGTFNLSIVKGDITFEQVVGDMVL